MYDVFKSLPSNLNSKMATCGEVNMSKSSMLVETFLFEGDDEFLQGSETICL